MDSTTLRYVITGNSTDEQLSEIAQRCEAQMDAVLINLQTVGHLINVANQSDEQDDFHNQIAGLIVKEMANEAQSLYLLKCNAEFILNQRQGGK